MQFFSFFPQFASLWAIKLATTLLESQFVEQLQNKIGLGVDAVTFLPVFPWGYIYNQTFLGDICNLVLLEPSKASFLAENLEVLFYAKQWTMT